MKLFQFIFENINIEEYESLSDYFYDNDSIPDEATLNKLFAKEQLSNPKFWFRKINFNNPNKLAYVYGYKQKDEPQFILDRDSDGSFAYSKIENWFQNIEMFQNQFEYYDIDFEQKFNDDFWSYPVTVYHGTPTQKTKKSILKNGLEPRSETRGLTNKSVGAAVFTSLEPEKTESYAGNFGTNGAILSINTKQMKQDGYTPFVSQEPEITEIEVLSSLAHKVGIYYEGESIDSGMDLDTIIFHGPIPPKYISVYENSGEENDSSPEELDEEKLANQNLMKKMGYVPVGKNYRLGSDTYIQNDDPTPSKSKQYINQTNKNIEKSNPSKKRNYADPSAVGISLPKRLKG